jgi:hypothetical protein
LLKIIIKLQIGAVFKKQIRRKDTDKINIEDSLPGITKNSIDSLNIYFWQVMSTSGVTIYSVNCKLLMIERPAEIYIKLANSVFCDTLRSEP